MRRTRLTLAGSALLSSLAVAGCTHSELPAYQDLSGRIADAQQAPHRTEFGKGAPSVLLHYVNPDGTRLPTASAFYSELTVGQTAPQSSFVVEGFGHGTVAFQQYDDGDDPRLALVVSINNPLKGSVAAADEHATATYASPLVQVNEQAKGQSGAVLRLPLAWRPHTTYRVLLTAAAAGAYTDYSPYLFFTPPGAAAPRWVRLATVRRATQDTGIFRPYALAEDTARTQQSATEVRQARIGNSWIYGDAQGWVPLTVARFTGQAKPGGSDAFDASAGPDGFSVTTGGNTVNVTGSGTYLTAPAHPAPPADVAGLIAAGGHPG